MSRERLGEGALQGGLVIRPAVRGEHVLDRLLQQGTQPFDDRLPRHVRTQPSGIDLEPATKVDERVAGDDRAMALSGKRLDTNVQSVARRGQVHLADPLVEKPYDVGAAVARLLGGEEVRLHEVFRGIGLRRAYGYNEPLHQALSRA